MELYNTFTLNEELVKIINDNKPKNKIDIDINLIISNISNREIITLDEFKNQFHQFNVSYNVFDNMAKYGLFNLYKILYSKNEDVIEYHEIINNLLKFESCKISNVKKRRG